ncbi:MAG: patatin-like phospholipase family protein [Pseudobacteriovorax sp.]|nr:patatin-like phospholipase family protein [Pseudobacteriovorax sp.]
MITRAMCFDGGGVGGVFTGTILRRIHEWNSSVLGMTKVFAGTSTGSIIACALALKEPIPPEDIVRIYKQAAPEIFTRKWIYRTIPFDRIFGTPYQLERLEKALWEVFGEQKLGDLRKQVFIPTLDGDRRLWGGKRRLADAYFFNNISQRDYDLNMRIIDVIQASSAAPLFFRPFQNRYMDGGLILNNPSIGLIAELMDQGIARENLVVLSVGTGKIAPYIDSDNRKIWDLRRFIKPVVASLTNSNMRVSTKLAHKLLEANYKRFAPSVSKDYQLDETLAMDRLELEANSLEMNSVYKWLQGFYRLYQLEGASAIPPLSPLSKSLTDLDK